MSNEFKPGHPVIFWIFIVVLIFFFFSAAKAVITSDDCGDSSVTKTWHVWPPEWECGGPGGISFID